MLHPGPGIAWTAERSTLNIIRHSLQLVHRTEAPLSRYVRTRLPRAKSDISAGTPASTRQQRSMVSSSVSGGATGAGGGGNEDDDEDDCELLYRPLLYSSSSSSSKTSPSEADESSHAVYVLPVGGMDCPGELLLCLMTDCSARAVALLLFKDPAAVAGVDTGGGGVRAETVAGSGFFSFNSRRPLGI